MTQFCKNGLQKRNSPSNVAAAGGKLIFLSES